MKKIIILLMAVFLSISITACTFNPLSFFSSDNKSSKKANKTKIENQKVDKNGNVKDNTNKQAKKSSKS